MAVTLTQTSVYVIVPLHKTATFLRYNNNNSNGVSVHTVQSKGVRGARAQSAIL